MKTKSTAQKFQQKGSGSQAGFSSLLGNKDFFSQLLSLVEHSRVSTTDAKKIYAFGYSQYQQARYMEAAETFLYLAIYSDVSSRNLKALAACYQAMTDFEKALPLYRLCFDLAPEDPYVHFYAAECLLRLGRKAGALQELRCTIKLSSGSEKFASMLKKASGMVELIDKSDLEKKQPPH